MRMLRTGRGRIMRIFVSWSGPLSREIASTIKEWLESVIQQVDVFMSETDIEPGIRWGFTLAEVLEECNYGIICLTRSNLNARWINFEAGALSKFVETGRVVSLLFGLKPTDVGQPLGQFQLLNYAERDMKKLVDSINNYQLPVPLASPIMDRTFVKWWPELKAKLDPLAEQAEAEYIEEPHAKTVTNQETLEEILSIVREQQRDLTSFIRPRIGLGWHQALSVFVIRQENDDVGMIEVSRFLAQFRITPIILTVPASYEGKLAEMLTYYVSRICYAIVLLAANNDEALNKGSHPSQSFTQRSILLGIAPLVRMLGIRSVFCLYKGSVDTEIPSDVVGVAFAQMDSSDKWKYALLGSMQQAGLDIDRNGPFGDLVSRIAGEVG